LDTKSATQKAIEYLQTGRLEQAEEIFMDILKKDPADFHAHFYLGNILQESGHREEAINFYQTASELNPAHAGPYFNLASILFEKGQTDEALACYQVVIKLDPGYADTYNSIGVILQSEGKFDEAAEHYQKAIELDPDFAFAYSNLGNVFLKKGLPDEAIKCFHMAIKIHPDYAKAHCNLGIALHEQGKLDEAVSNYQKALRLNPDFAEALNGLGRVFHTRGQFDDAEINYRLALKIKPDHLCYSNLLLMMNYDSRYTSKAVFEEHLRFAKQIAEPMYPASSHYENKRSPSRRLKIGYMSPDFRRHSVNYFIEPVLSSHNHERFEVFCYSDVHIPDNVTEKLRGHADQWRNIAGVSDQKVAELVQKDAIDILIDLAGHTGYNRMLVFARKPAPIQVSWLGYPNTTGLSTIDYRIVDSYTDPPGLTDPFYTEELIRMPDSFLCYQPDADSPDVGPLPATANGNITFGSFNNFTKETPEVLALWADIMKRVPYSRLILKAKSFRDNIVCRNVLDIFAGCGITSDRIELFAHSTSFREHLGLYNRIDIGLDPFPYNGTTTTCEAIWMGVPVITLAGKTHSCRVGASLLTNTGLPELVAGTNERYIHTAVSLAGDIKRLEALRKALRHMMKESVLTDSNKFIAGLESLFRSIWNKWCQIGH
jgi:protein O-GlcNAc transferase